MSYDKKLNELAHHHTKKETGVDPHNESDLQEYGENSWFSKLGEHESRLAKMPKNKLIEHHNEIFGSKIKKSDSMDKLLELEKKLREAKASLEKNSMMGYDEVNGSLAQSEDHDDEKEDKRLIAEAMDVHNEKKHGEDKDKNSAYKDMKIKKEEGDVIKMEAISFAKNGQWSLDKADKDSTYIENSGKKKNQTR